MKLIFRRTLSALLFSLLASGVSAQAPLPADSLYTLARTAAFEHKDYPEAIALAKKAMAQSPDNTDLIVFLARLHTWNQQPDSGRAYFEAALKLKPQLEDAYVGYTDLEFWNNDDERALAIAQRGLSYHPGSVPLLLRKAKMLYKARAFGAAIAVVDTVLQLDKNNTDARSLAAQIRDNVSKNRVGIRYDYVHFDKQFPDPWHLLSVDYTRQTKAGAFTARLNYANRFGRDGLQYEAEAYPVFSKTFYAYVNAGFSGDAGVFPKWKAGASLYANLPRAFEAEIGMRYLYFTSGIVAYTAYAGKYYRSFLFGARTYLTPSRANVAQAYSVLARYYFGGIDDYIALNAGAGISPDDRRLNVQLNNTYKQRTYTGELAFRKAIKKLNIITLAISLINQEYRPGTVGNQFQLGAGYIRRF